MAKYLGPSDVFIVGDRQYRQGDNVPMSKELVEHHARAGHRFEGVDESEAVAVNPDEPVAFGDAGEVVKPGKK